jgi:alkaline phosphatase
MAETGGVGVMNKRRGLLIRVVAGVLAIAVWHAGAVAYASGADQGGVAHSLIFFIGDGMGPQIVSIAKVYVEEALDSQLSMVGLANSGTAGYMTTNSADRLVTDSAASGTAMATGSKTGNGVVGLAVDGSRLVNLFEMAVETGKSVGVITTTSVTDATPASFLAHVPNRQRHYEIAEQIVAGDAAVVMGGGYMYFLPRDRGSRPDGKDLTQDAENAGFDVVLDRKGLLNAKGQRLLGLFAPDALPFDAQRDEESVPSLAEMMQAAVRVLAGDPDGYVLVVEGGRIDHAEHDNDIGNAIGDLIAFDECIGLAMGYQAIDSTLTLVVSADHDCGGPAITSGGYGYPGYQELERIARGESPFVKWVSGDHTGTMVPVFVRGPGARRFSGIQDNTDLFRNMAWSLGL